MNFADIPLCQQEDIEARISGLPFVPASPAKFHEACARKETLIRERMQDELQAWAKKKYPDTVEDWITRLLGIYSDARKRLNAQFAVTGTNTIVQFPGSELTQFDIQEYQRLGQGPLPRTFFKAAQPVSGAAGDYVNVAKNGTFYVDTLNEALYINRSTDTATVTWVAFETDDLINFILNPRKLVRPAITRLILELLEDGTLKAKMDGSVQSGELMEKTIPRYEKMYREDMNLALTNLRIDITGDGLISNFEKRTGGSKDYVF